MARVGPQHRREKTHLFKNLSKDEVAPIHKGVLGYGGC
jgi:hypothetical protein